MYLTAYRFDGDPTALAAAHDEMTAGFQLSSLDLHLCLTTEDGIIVLDGCPSREVAEAFQQGEAFRHAISAAGLPTPRIESLGEIVWSTVRTS
jgi:hypothetical protein